MRRIKRIAALLLAAALCAALLTGCGEKKQTSTGLDLAVCLGGAPETLDPIYATSNAEETVIEHLYENLMKVGADTSGSATATNGLAKSYDTEENYDGTVTYTFHLRSAKWSDGTPVKADDFVYAWQRLANPASASPNAPVLSIVAGYDAVRSSGDVSQLQVEAKNDSTLVVTLIGQCPWFLTDVCTAAATMPLRQDVVKKLKATAQEKNQQASSAEERVTWSSDPTKLVANGPYVVGSDDEGQDLLLISNGRYTGLSSGPDSIKFYFAETAEDAWALYEAGTVDFVAPLPEEQMAELTADGDWSAAPELNTYTLLYNTSAEPFSDPLVRQAFSLAIDRAALCETAGVETRPATGLVPVGVPESENADFRTCGGDLVDCDSESYSANCVKARSLLEQAGFENAYSFPALEYLYVDEGNNAAVANALTKMWSQALRVKVTPKGVPEDKFETLLKSGDYTLAAGNVRGYANDAESFLSVWTSSNENNVVRYFNSAYDTLLMVIESASDETARLGCLHDAESLLMEDCPLTPLYVTGTAWKLRDGLTGVCRDARGFFSFATTAVADSAT